MLTFVHLVLQKISLQPGISNRPTRSLSGVEVGDQNAPPQKWVALELALSAEKIKGLAK